MAAGQTIQSAIDAAAPGDMIIVPPGTYKELLIMWKPVRLQGVGAASTIINGDTQPSGVIDPWRHQISCLFGLALNGQPYTGNGPSGGTNPYDSTDPANGGLSCPGNGWKYFTAPPGVPQVDRIPFEGILGWDTTVNGNLAEMLQEPTLMGSYEGAGITVLSKGVRVPAGTDWFGVGAEAAYWSGLALSRKLSVTVETFWREDEVSVSMPSALATACWIGTVMKPLITIGIGTGIDRRDVIVVLVQLGKLAHRQVECRAQADE